MPSLVRIILILKKKKKKTAAAWPLLLLYFFIPREIRRRRQWHPTPVLLPGKFHGQRSLVGCSLWGRKELDMTERLHFHFSLSCIGEGNGNPLQCSCLENPRDRGAWWLPSMGSHRVGQDWSDLAAAAAGKSESLSQWWHPLWWYLVYKGEETQSFSEIQRYSL